jgi:drug/metabolite transporter (DMT)-like permease
VTQNHLYFLAMCLAWGLTWIAVKAGITALPPIFFGGMRFVLVVAILLIFVRGWLSAFAPDIRARVLVSALFVNILSYILLFWGMQHVASGVASIINLALMPVSLYLLAILVGDERPSWRHAAALVLGIAGLGALFADRASLSLADREVLGALAIVGATLTYAVGSIIGKPLLSRLGVWQMITAQALVGALVLPLIAFAVEPVTRQSFAVLVSPVPLAALVFLVLSGTFVGYAIFLRLVRDWGAPRAGLYAFVSPVVALLAGWLAFGEQIGWTEIAGGALMFSGAALALLRDSRLRDR